MSLRMRRFARYPLNGKVRVCWENERRENIACTGKIVDVSLAGMQIAIPYPIAPQSIIQFQFFDGFFEGSASARSCLRKGVNYQIGLEFCGGLRWTQPVEEQPPVAAQ